MTLPIRQLDRLSAALPASRLFGDWLEGNLPAALFPGSRANATAELEEFRSCRHAAANVPTPFFRNRGPAEWRTLMREDLASDRDRAGFDDDLAGLAAGGTGIVVTGQQPGWMGGPLYTLHKIATTVALAAERSRAGLPTVPVFWSGDDDDDLDEAHSPVAWDPAGSRLVGSGSPQGSSGRRQGRTMVGTWPTGEADPEVGSLLETLGAEGDGLAVDLAAIWKAAAREGLQWSRLQRRFLLRIFAGTGLMIVSGNDPDLHRLAEPLYLKITERLPDLADCVRLRGREFEAGGWHAQLAARSMARPLFTASGRQRVPWEPGPDMPRADTLRPGVMLRSPIQDWLLEPAAVVVGPGELAYLRQLDGLYDALDLRRCPLVPRLFAWLVPAGFDPERLRVFREPVVADPGQAGRWAADLASDSADRLKALLERELGLDPDRASSLAAGRARRWRKGVSAMLAGEIDRIGRSRRPTSPPWVFPHGERQERRLSGVNAACLWGESLAAELIEAAGRHLESGLRGDWREFSLEVAVPRASKG